jgi:hypothetical protein
MAHFARLNQGSIVTNVIVVANQELMDQDGKESEAKGIAFCQSLFGTNSIWKQGSYTGKIRKNYPGIGYIYDEARDAFIPPRPFESWALDESSCTWQPPIPYPTDGSIYVWDEDALNWVVDDQTP